MDSEVEKKSGSVIGGNQIWYQSGRWRYRRENETDYIILNYEITSNWDSTSDKCFKQWWKKANLSSYEKETNWLSLW